MKKVLLIAVVLLFISGLVFAEGDTHAKYVYEFRIENISGINLTTVIPITSIRPEVDKLVGYRVLTNYKVRGSTGGATENYCGLYDGTDKTLSGECFGESESVNGGTEGEVWLIPKKILTGVVVQQGARTTVIVYFTRE